MSTPKKPRNRVCEQFGPRPIDFIAPRLQLVAALAREGGLAFEAEGSRWTGDTLRETAEDQARIEQELVDGFDTFRAIVMRHDAAIRQRSALLARATELLAPIAPKNDVRLCKLRRPPIGKVESAIAASLVRARR